MNQDAKYQACWFPKSILSSNSSNYFNSGTILKKELKYRLPCQLDGLNDQELTRLAISWRSRFDAGWIQAGPIACLFEQEQRRRKNMFSLTAESTSLIEFIRLRDKFWRFFTLSTAVALTNEAATHFYFIY